MPEALTYIIAVPTTTVAVGTRGGASVNNGGVLIPVPIVSKTPIQVAGLTPMTPCAYNECRSLPIGCCERLDVFGNTQDSKTLPVTQIPVASSTYENDLNDWLMDCQLVGTVPTWKIEKCGGKNVWSTVATITNNQYGDYKALTTLTEHLTYTGFTVNWGRVLVGLGVGVYRIKFSSVYTRGESITSCFVSPEFNLRKFNCQMATRTVKFECVMPAQIGKHDNSGYLFNLCNLSWFSSIRVAGFFGSKTVPTYNKTFNKFNTGQIEHVHNEAIRKWKFDSMLLSRTLHDRLEVYMMLAQTVVVSDYNKFNTDYNINQLPVDPASGYDTTDYNTALPPKSSAIVEFNAGIQNIIANNCCNLK